MCHTSPLESGDNPLTLAIYIFYILEILLVALKIFALVVYGHFQSQNKYHICTDIFYQQIQCS